MLVHLILTLCFFFHSHSQVVASNVVIINFSNTSRTYTMPEVTNPYIICSINSLTFTSSSLSLQIIPSVNGTQAALTVYLTVSSITGLSITAQILLLVQLKQYQVYNTLNTTSSSLSHIYTSTKNLTHLANDPVNVEYFITGWSEIDAQNGNQIRITRTLNSNTYNISILALKTPTSYILLSLFLYPSSLNSRCIGTGFTILHHITVNYSIVRNSSYIYSFGLSSIFSGPPISFSIFLQNTTIIVINGNFSFGYLILDSSCLYSLMINEYPATSLEVWKIVLIAIGVTMLVGLLAGGIYYLVKWKKERASVENVEEQSRTEINHEGNGLYNNHVNGNRLGNMGVRGDEIGQGTGRNGEDNMNLNQVSNPRANVVWKGVQKRNRDLKNDIVPEDKVEWTKNELDQKFG